MPFKDPKKQRESWKRWFKKNKESQRLKLLARHAAKQSFKQRQNCSFKDCDQLGERHHKDYQDYLDIVWLCRKHHLFLHNSSKLRRSCGVEGCKGKHEALNLCKNHYESVLYHRKNPTARFNSNIPVFIKNLIISQKKLSPPYPLDKLTKVCYPITI